MGKNGKSSLVEPLRGEIGVEVSLRDIRRSLRALLRQTGIQFVVLNALGQYPTSGWFRRSLSATAFLAGVAREFHAAFLALVSTLPGDFEQHADRIIDVRRTIPSNDAEVWVLRNRFGSTGRVNLRLNPGWLTVEDDATNTDAGREA